LASLEYPEKGNHWDEMCADQKYGSPINLDYTYNNFVFVPNTDRKIELSAGYYNGNSQKKLDFFNPITRRHQRCFQKRFKTVGHINLKKV
jgi:hypothetical protein